jgi:hypothetical protein
MSVGLRLESAELDFHGRIRVYLLLPKLPEFGNEVLGHDASCISPIVRISPHSTAHFLSIKSPNKQMEAGKKYSELLEFPFVSFKIAGLN